jgi:hypothetical protein
MIVDAHWYVPNTVIRSDLHIPTDKEEIHRYNSQYGARLSVHTKDFVANSWRNPTTTGDWEDIGQMLY